MKRPAHFEALAFRVWAYAHPRGWDCTAGEVADALGVSNQAVRGVVVRKHWLGRFRVTTFDFMDAGNNLRTGTIDGVRAATIEAVENLHKEGDGQ